MTDEDDPWDGWPDTPWILDGYVLDDALCDLLEIVRRHKDGEEAINRFITRVRARYYDKKEINDTAQSE